MTHLDLNNHLISIDELDAPTPLRARLGLAALDGLA